MIKIGTVSGKDRQRLEDLYSLSARASTAVAVGALRILPSGEIVACRSVADDLRFEGVVCEEPATPCKGVERCHGCGQRLPESAITVQVLYATGDRAPFDDRMYCDLGCYAAETVAERGVW